MFEDGHPSLYLPGPMSINFVDQTNIVSRKCLKNQQASDAIYTETDKNCIEKLTILGKTKISLGVGGIPEPDPFLSG